MAFQYLVYDIESVVDKSLLNRTLYAGQNMSDDEAYQKHVADLMSETKKNFVNAAFHVPVCLAAVAVTRDFAIQKIGLVGEGKREPAAIVNHFWTLYNQNNFIPVDFNGRGYDMRLLELWAFRLGLQIHAKHFEKFGVRYRYSEEKHLDLHEAITNSLSIRYQGGLNMLAKLIGKPGKFDVHGDMVQDMHEAGKHFDIEDYCLGDAMDTYFVFLRWMVVRGVISLERETALVTQAIDYLKKHSDETGYLKKYLSVLTQNQ